MTSTRNRNTYGDYQLENNQNNALLNTFISDSRIYRQNCIAGDGLLSGGKYPANILSSQQIDTETFLLGIGSTNLTLPPSASSSSAPSKNLSHLPSLNIFQRNAVVFPEPLVVRDGQRPAFN